MNEQYTYGVSVEWAGGRAGVLRSAALPDLRVAAPPEFKGPGGFWTPEHLFVAAVNSCFMTTFAAVAELSKLDFTTFSSDATGKLERAEGRGYSITEVTLRPRLTVARAEDADRAARLLEKAERNCLISNSINSAVRLEPEVVVAPVVAESPTVAVGGAALTAA